MSKPKVSVIIPSMPGREHVLQRAVLSVDAQRYLNTEKIIVKDKNLSAPKARNIGIKKATGEYTAFLDDDDEWHPDKLYLQLSLFDMHKNCGIVTCYSEDHRFGQVKINKPPKKVLQKDVLNAFNYSSTSTYVFKTDILKKLKGFDESLKSAQEYELAIRVLKQYTARCFPEVLVKQYATIGQISVDWKRKRQGLKQVYCKHKKDFIKASKWNIIKYRGIYLIYFVAPLFGKSVYKIITPIKKRYED